MIHRSVFKYSIYLNIRNIKNVNLTIKIDAVSCTEVNNCMISLVFQREGNKLKDLNKEGFLASHRWTVINV